MSFKDVIREAYNSGKPQEYLSSLILPEAKARKWNVNKLQEKVAKWLNEFDKENEQRQLQVLPIEGKRASKPAKEGSVSSAREIIKTSDARTKTEEKRAVDNAGNDSTKVRKSKPKKLKVENTAPAPSKRKSKTSAIPFFRNPKMICFCGCGAGTTDNKSLFIKGHGNSLRQRFRKIRGLIKYIKGELSIIDKGLPNNALEYARLQWPEYVQFYEMLKTDCVLDALKKV